MMRTLCPACGTAFRVTPEQLKARLGMVRCGQCHSQFNALEALTDETVAASPVATESHVEPQKKIVAPPAPEEIVQEPAIPEQELDVVSESAEIPAEPLFVAPTEELPATETVRPARPPRHLRSAILGDNYDVTFDAMPDDETTPPRRWPWAAGIVLAMLALTAQAALHYRVELAVLQPRLKPVLRAACNIAGCQIPLPRRSEYLGIEASDLHPNPTQKGQLLLAATLRNRAPFAQEFPYLELTLNDVADQPLIVKALTPRDYLPKEIGPGKGFLANGDLAVNLTLDVGDVPAAGYRIYLFYP